MIFLESVLPEFLPFKDLLIEYVQIHVNYVVIN